MKIFRITLITCLLINSLLLSGTVLAQDEELPDPGITPDSPFYFLDNWGKSIGLLFAFGPEAKAKKALKYAEERLSEVRLMAAKNRVREMTRAAGDYDGFMAMVNEKVAATADDSVSELVALATSRHLSILDGIKDQVPGEVGETIARAREASMNGQENALRALAIAKPETAIDIASATIENRLERARIKATEDVTAEVEEALDYVARIAEIEEEMAAIAQEKGIDIVPIQQRLAQATSNRLEVLTEVYEKAPEQARPAIENAIENSVRKYERAMIRLRQENAPGAATEGAPLLQKERAEVKKQLRATTSNQEQGSDNNAGNQSATETQKIEPEVSYQIPTDILKATASRTGE